MKSLKNIKKFKQLRKTEDVSRETEKTTITGMFYQYLSSVGVCIVFINFKYILHQTKNCYPQINQNYQIMYHMEYVVHKQIK